MSPTESPVTLPGGDATKGRFEWFHNACGTIYADTEDDAIACAYHRILPHDPGNAAASAVRVERVGYNAAHGSDWVAPVPVAATPQANPAILDIAVPGATAVPNAPDVHVPMTPQPEHEAAIGRPLTPPTAPPVAPAPPSTGGTLPSDTNAPDFGAGA